ncbi:hypothetical protein GDI1391 [Gluconacetobacter diazotrophicus PA1 5]|uniref:Uncharacterized protein n=1 Tax=Gluconacetobacter diazotrophicus (strain ATCC 49037 / DSM 5601 / CCUG 37298 / CIP 103539 / LMG 7603 / PAl5) TaxID=272568 RepID=A9HFA6_GLUDA|nr:hypothetical protein GDI1391 [Gluconacetobacter diazotrophicus PA1 5]
MSQDGRRNKPPDGRAWDMDDGNAMRPCARSWRKAAGACEMD